MVTIGAPVVLTGFLIVNPGEDELGRLLVKYRKE